MTGSLTVSTGMLRQALLVALAVGVTAQNCTPVSECIPADNDSDQYCCTGHCRAVGTLLCGFRCLADNVDDQALDDVLGTLYCAPKSSQEPTVTPAPRPAPTLQLGIVALAITFISCAISTGCFFICLFCVGNGTATETRMKQHLENKEKLMLASRSEAKAGDDVGSGSDHAPPSELSDLVEAVRKGPFTFGDLVSVIFCSNDTICSLTPRVARELFVALDHDKKGTVDLTKLVAAPSRLGSLCGVLAAHANDPALHRLFSGNKLKVELSLSEIPTNGGSEALDADAWLVFTTRLRRTRVMVLRSTALSQNQLFFGKGIERRSKLADFLCSCLPCGWVEDMLHFMRNKAHPVLSMIFGSRLNAITACEQFFIATILYSWLIMLTALQFKVLVSFSYDSGSLTESTVNRSWTSSWSSMLIVVLPTQLIQNFIVSRLANASDVGASQGRWYFWRWARQFRKRLKRGMLATFACFSYGMSSIGFLIIFSTGNDMYQGRTSTEFVTLNIQLNILYAMFLPLALQYNPSTTLFSACSFLKNVRNILNSEAHGLVGHRIMVFNATGGNMWCPRLSSYPSSAELAEMGAGIVESVDPATSMCVVRLDKSTRNAMCKENDGEADQRVFLRPMNLASLDWINKRARIVDGGVSAPTGTIESFDVTTGLFAVQMSSLGALAAGIRHVEPHCLKLLGEDDDARGGADESRSGLYNNPLFQEEQPAQEKNLSVHSLEKPAPETWEVELAQLGDLAKQVSAVGSKAAEKTSRFVEESQEAANKAARKAARQFVSHPMGKVVGPIAGWVLLDALNLCGWLRQRQHALEVMRSAVKSRGAEHMSDVDVRRFEEEGHAKPKTAASTLAGIIEGGSSEPAGVVEEGASKPAAADAADIKEGAFTTQATDEAGEVGLGGE